MAQSIKSRKSESSSMHGSETDVESAPVFLVDEAQLTQKKRDVDWEGDDDPEMALNWPARRKWTYIIMLASLTLLTYAAPKLLLLISSYSRLTILPQAVLFINVRSRHPSCNVRIRIQQ
jgi:hypothetical protein